MDYKHLAETLFLGVTQTPIDMEEKFPPRNLPNGAIVSRMAPSPTGFVHLGNLVQGLTSERLCHQSGGVLFLRVEDTDAKREVEGAVETLIEALRHYDINFDEGVTKDGFVGEYGPYHQRKRKDIYHVYAKHLVSEGYAYPCFCSEEELSTMHDLQEAEKSNFGYFGKWAVWRDRSIEDINEELSKGTPWVLRFRSRGSDKNNIKFTDLIKGDLELTENDTDHVLLKSDGIPTYHFAHVVDDHLMHTTHVIRGDEWLPTLPLHLQIFSALDLKPPKYLHIGPLMKMEGNSKRKLSKRKDPELALTYYKAEGFPTQAVYEYILTILNSNFEDWRRANPDKPIDEFKFSYKKMNSGGALFDYIKLSDISKNIISKMTAEEVYKYVLEWAKEFDVDFYNVLSDDRDFAISVFSIGRGGKKPRKDFATWGGVLEYMGFFYNKYFEIIDSYPEKFNKDTIKNILLNYKEVYSELDDNSLWFEKIKQLADKNGFACDMKEYKNNPEGFPGSVADISMFIRIAITGKMNSPDMHSVMQILSKNRVFARIDSMISKL